MFELVLVGFLYHEHPLTNSDVDILADLHTSDAKLVQVKVDMRVSVLAIVGFATAWAESLLSNHLYTL